MSRPAKTAPADDRTPSERPARARPRRRFRPFYFFGRAVAHLRGAPMPAIVTAATIAIAIFLFGAFLLTGRNLEAAFAGSAAEGEAMTVYFRKDAAPEALRRAAEAARAMPEIAAAREISPEDALRELRAELGDDGAVLEGVDARDALPPMLTVMLRDPRTEPHAIESLTARLRNLEAVEFVESATEWLERFRRFVTIGRAVGLFWAGLLGFGCLLVIGNTARLAALTRAQEIEVLSLVGASDAFIVAPFAWEGALVGLLGSAFGVALLAGAFFGLQWFLWDDPLFRPFLAGLVFLDRWTLAALGAAGPLLGAFGSGASAARFLRGRPL